MALRLKHTAMPESKEPGIRTAFNIIATVLAIFGFGLEMEGTHSYLGMLFMAAAIIYGAWELFTSKAPAIRFLPVPIRGVFVLAVFAGALWVSWPQIHKIVHNGGKITERDSYSVVAETFLAADYLPETLEKAILWTVFQTEPKPGACIKSPVNALVYFRVVNQQETAQVISELSIKVKTIHGWDDATYLPQLASFFWVDNHGRDFTNAVHFRAVMLDTELRDRAIGPNETIKGWLALTFPAKPPRYYVPEFRFTIADTLGGKTVAETGKVPAGNLSYALIQVIDRQDISSCRTKLP